MRAEELLLPGHSLIQEPLLAFHPLRPEDKHSHPLIGLSEFGPYSRSLVSSVLDPIRVAAIVPHGSEDIVGALLAELGGRQLPRERKQYLVEFPGFSQVFGIRCVKAPPSSARLELARDLDSLLTSSPEPYRLLADHIGRAIAAYAQQRARFDVLLIYIPERWEGYLFGPPEEQFDLHDHLKAISATLSVPIQIIRETSALRYSCRASVAWRLSIAIYCKSGGVPWKLADSSPDTAYIGLGYAIRRGAEGGPRFVTCCSQVFEADGAGLEFIAYETDQQGNERQNPFLSRADMRAVMARSLALYQRRHAGRLPKNVVVHKSTEFKPDEIEGCFDAWRLSEGMDLIQVQDEAPWRGVEIEAPRGGNTRGRAANYPVRRGSYMSVGGREVLLWTQGNAPEPVGGQNYYKEGKGIPRPLLLHRFAGHGSWLESCRALLGLTKMDWNTDALYSRLPVTISYANVLARTVKRMPSLMPTPYESRYFM